MPTHPIARVLLLTVALAVASAASAALVTGSCGGSGKDLEDPAGAVAFRWTEGATGCSAWVDRDGDGRPDSGAWLGAVQDQPAVGAGVVVSEKRGVIGSSGGAGLAIDEAGVHVYGGGGGGGLLFGVVGRDASSIGGGGISARVGPEGPSGSAAFGEGVAIHEEGVRRVAATVGGAITVNEEGVRLASGGAGGGLEIHEEGVQIGTGAGADAGIAINEEGVQVTGGGNSSSARATTSEGPDADADGVLDTFAQSGEGGTSTGSSDARNLTLAADGFATGADVGGSTFVGTENGAAYATTERSTRVPRGVADGSARATTDGSAAVSVGALGTRATCNVGTATDPDEHCGDL